MIDRAAVEEIVPLIGRGVDVLHMPFWNEAPGGGDVDCMVDELDPRWPLRLEGGWRLCQELRYDVTASYWVLERNGDVLAVDTLDDPDGIGRYGLKTATPAHNGNGVPAAIRGAYLTSKRIAKDLRDAERWAAIAKLAGADPNLYKDQVARIFGPDLGLQIADAGLAGRAPDGSVWRRARRAQAKRRLGLAGGPEVMAMRLGRIIRRALAPTGMIVVLAGPDGVGKSTVAGALLDETAPLFRRQVHAHWRPGLLPRPGALVRRSPVDAGDPHSRSAKGVPASSLLLGYHFLDFFLGGWLRWMPMKARTGLVLVERSWWDIAADPGRYGLRVNPRVVRLLGALLPQPDAVILLDGDAGAIAARKAELPEAEIDRQLKSWRSFRGVVPVDTGRPVEEVVERTRETIVDALECRALRRLDGGWLRFSKLILPRSSLAGSTLAIHQPVTPRQRQLERIGRIAARTGLVRLLPRGDTPPSDVRAAVAGFLPRGGTFSVARSTHEGRWAALVVDRKGAPVAFVKVATTEEGRSALAREHEALDSFGGWMPATVRAPKILGHGHGWIAFEGFEYTFRRHPEVIPIEVADALGRFYRHGSDDGGGRGLAHGDFAPWNLLQLHDGWALIDWEEAHDNAEPFHDLFHHAFHCHALIRGMTAPAVAEGFVRLEGPLGAATRAYASAAGLDYRQAPAAFVSYLTNLDPLTGSLADSQAKMMARARLLRTTREIA